MGTRRINQLLAAGLLIGGAVIAVAVALYDPAVEVFPGRTMPRSQADKTLAVWDAPGRGSEAKWINPDPKPSGEQPLSGGR